MVAVRSFRPLLRVRPPADPVGVQQDQLRRLLAHARGTAWGREYGFDDMSRASDCISAFQSRVPRMDPASFRPAVDRILAGERDVLWPGRIRRFAVSSGTISEGKLIPLSGQMLRTIRRATLEVTFNYIAETGNTDILRGRVLSLPGQIDNHPVYPDVRIGGVSGFIAEAAPSLLARYLQATMVHKIRANDWAERLDLAVERTLEMDVRSLSLTPTWGPVLFQKLLAAFTRRFGRTAQTVREVWPRLKVMFCGGAPLSGYRPVFDAFIGEPGVDIMELYGASEGFFAMQIRPEDDDLLLRLDTGVFYEFVRADELEMPNPRRYTVADVEPGIRYALYVSTCAGLWAYGMHDVVRFTSTSPHRIQVAGRTGEMLDGHGEAVFADEARKAIQGACAATGARITHFHVAPSKAQAGEPPAHEWLIECDREPSDAQVFASTIDAELQRMNRRYGNRRGTEVFGAPRVRVLPPGTFHSWMKQTRGQVGAQSKVPCMTGDRGIAEGLIGGAWE